MNRVGGGLGPKCVDKGARPAMLASSDLGKLGSSPIPGDWGRNDRTYLPSLFSLAVF